MNQQQREHLDKAMQHAETSCKASGARLTDKRKSVLKGLLMSGKALSAYELIDVCKQEFEQTLPAMSMYRILDFLQGEHLVHKLHLTNKYVACAHISGEDDHDGLMQFLICRQCQTVKEVVIDAATMNQLKHNVDQAGFTFSSPQLEIDCVCKQCSDKF